MKRLFLLMVALTIGSAAALPLQAMAQVGITISIGTAPPPVRYEAVPPPRSGYVWAPGYWDWDGHAHVWSAGHWERVRPGYVYARPEWREDHGKWQLHKGGWKHDRKHVQKRYDKHHDYHCPPGQAKKGNC